MIGTRSTDKHQGQQPYALHQQAGHMAAPDRIAERQNNPCQTGASTYGPRFWDHGLSWKSAALFDKRSG
jgi:hypothetical protein